MTEIIYLHGFASGPNSNKACAFKKRFEELKIPIYAPDLQENDFENLTLSRQVKLIQSIIDDKKDKEFGLIGSSMGGYLATLTAQTRDTIKA
ncbi:MAG: YqiA/YcfP family alpha/beta fold hydrolase, partial [Nitrospinota bacterium]|nr:YqiA/YcfP family alpha/beta fold hydrolase [Nitrospinota bacterium]